jgi:hypothetical protein
VRTNRPARGRNAIAVLALILCAACESIALAPEPSLVPQAASAGEAALVLNGVDYDALLIALNSGQPVEPEQRERVRMLVETLARMSPPPGAEPVSAPAVSPLSAPAVERALREWAASPDAEGAKRVLERLIAERRSR